MLIFAARLKDVFAGAAKKHIKHGGITCLDAPLLAEDDEDEGGSFLDLVTSSLWAGSADTNIEERGTLWAERLLAPLTELEQHIVLAHYWEDRNHADIGADVGF